MADKNYEDDFSPVYAIGYPKSVGDHFGEYEVLKVGNKTVVFDDTDSIKEFLKETGNPFLQRHTISLKVANYYPEDAVIHYSWVSSDLIEYFKEYKVKDCSGGNYGGEA